MLGWPLNEVQNTAQAVFRIQETSMSRHMTMFGILKWQLEYQLHGFVQISTDQIAGKREYVLTKWAEKGVSQKTLTGP